MTAKRRRARLLKALRRRRFVTLAPLGAFEAPAETITYHEIPRTQ